MNFVVLLVILGLCFGSFVNALVWRVYMQSKKQNQKPKKNKDQYSITKGRSMCINCDHTLSTLDLVPVFSWVFLRGKCRYCHKPISIQYPLIELVSAVLFGLSYVFWPSELVGIEWLVFGLWLVVLVGMLALVVYDIRWMLLPDRIVYKLYWVGILYALLILYSKGSMDQLLNLGGSIFLSYGLFFILYQISKGRWIGGGDVKLGLLLGLIISDTKLAFLMLFTSSLLGMLYIGPALAIGKIKRTSRVAFGPFLIIATILVVLFGKSIVDWYMQKVLML